MFCTCCSNDFPDKDFLMKSEICCHCVYKKKMKLINKNKNSDTHTCRVCNKTFFTDKNKKIRQRSVYCSKECAHSGHKEQMQNFWTNKVNCTLIFN